MMKMNVVPDFEELLSVFGRCEVRYLVIGGLAFIYHVKPRFTKDMDLWVEATDENIARANKALAEFGSPYLLDPDDKEQVLQIGLQPNRVDILLKVNGPAFDSIWGKRIVSKYGAASVNWIDLDSLLAIKEKIDSPRHKSDVLYLRKVKEMQAVSIRGGRAGSDPGLRRSGAGGDHGHSDEGRCLE